MVYNHVNVEEMKQNLNEKIDRCNKISTYHELYFHQNWKDVWEEVIKIKKEILPDYIYRYRSIRDIDSMITDYFCSEKYRIRLSKPNEFNDPYDTWLSGHAEESPIIKMYVMRNIYSQYPRTSINDDSIYDDALIEASFDLEKASNGEHWLDEVALVYSSTSDLLRKKITYEQASKQLSKWFQMAKDTFTSFSTFHMGIACFASNVESFLMWSHYADSHRGFCLEYNTNKIAEMSDTCVKSSLWNSLIPVLYDNEVMNVADKVEMRDKYNVKIPHLPNKTNFVKECCTHKSLDWIYEEEWRLISDNPRFRNVHNENVTSSNSRLNNRMLDFVTPSRIYLGARISKSDEEKLISFANRLDIDVKKMSLKNNLFALESKNM